METFQKIINIVGALLLALFAYYQVNDGDGILWILIYGYGTILGFLGAFNRYYYLLPLIGLAGYTIYALTLNPQWGPEWLENEEAREFIGLMICNFWMLVNLVFKKTSRKYKRF